MDSSPPTSSQDKAYAYLKDRIIHFGYRPNQRLKALEIARHLDLSRTPVKEALSRLEQEGLVRRDLGSGYVIEPIRARDILNMYKVREILEVEAAREAVAHITPATIESLAAILDKARGLLQEGRLDEFMRTNREFYLTIFAAARNDVLLHILEGLNCRIWSMGSIVVKRYPPRADQILLENRRVLKALRSRDRKAIEHAIRAHIQAAGENVQKFLEGEDHYFSFASA